MAEQTLDHQRTQAEAAGFTFDHVIADHGVSGVAVKMRDRPEGKRLFDMLRKGDTLVVRWIDRLGRNYDDVTDTIREFIRRGVTVRTVINGLTFDGQPKDAMSAAVRDALVAFMAAMGEAQAEATKEAQRAGIAAARAKQGPIPGTPTGAESRASRPSTSPRCGTSWARARGGRGSTDHGPLPPDGLQDQGRSGCGGSGAGCMEVGDATADRD